VFPGTKRKRPLAPNESLISIEKAQKVLGYAPEHDWQPGRLRAPRKTVATLPKAVSDALKKRR
jgi:hypothetical protein